MSFSFNVSGKTKAEARTAAATELQKVVESQPAHEHDAAAVLNAIDAHLMLVDEAAEGEKVLLNCYGSLTRSFYDPALGLQINSCRVVWASVAVSVSVTRE